jgi:hypothetical protein
VARAATPAFVTVAEKEGEEVSPSSELQLILVRCRRFEVQVSFDHFGGLSPLEEHLLLALAAGEASVDALAAAFGLPRRLVLDACMELLQAGFLVVDGKTLAPSPTVRASIGPDPRQPSPGWARRLASAAPPEPETVVLLQELLSGSLIVPPQGSGFREPRPPEAPIHPEIPRLEDVSKLDLLLALGKVRPPRRDDDSRARPTQESRPSRIREARIMRSAGAGAGALVSRDATIVVSLVARHDDVDGSTLPRFGVVGPDTIPVGVRRRMSLALADLWQRGHGRGPKQFFTRLTFADMEEEADSLRPTRHPRRVVEALAAEWEAAQTKPPPEVHARLDALEREASDALGELILYRGRSQWTLGAQTQRASIIDALDAAKQQLVIVAVDDLVADEDLADRVRAAAERGLTVFLVESDAPTHEQAVQRFNGVARTSKGGGVVVSSCLMESGARLVVCDLDWVQVASGGHTRGLRVAAHLPGRVASAVSEILGWIRNQLVDGRHKRQLLDSPTLFGRRIDEVGVLSELPAPGQGPFEAFWRLAWSERVKEHAQRLATALPLAVPVFDGEHRELWDLGIRDAKERLLIASTQSGSSPLPASLVEGLLAASGRGVDVRLVLDAESLPGPEIRHQCRDLVAAGARVESRSEPGCLLVCDDWCVVGSYRSLLPTSTQRHELSVRVFGDDTVDAVFDSESE